MIFALKKSEIISKETREVIEAKKLKIKAIKDKIKAAKADFGCDEIR